MVIQAGWAHAQLALAGGLSIAGRKMVEEGGVVSPLSELV